MKDFHKQLHHQPPALEDERFPLGKYLVVKIYFFLEQQSYIDLD